MLDWASPPATRWEATWLCAEEALIHLACHFTLTRRFNTRPSEDVNAMRQQHACSRRANTNDLTTIWKASKIHDHWPGATAEQLAAECTTLALG